MPTVEARITKVEQDVATDWYRISTDDERVKRLDTKVAEKAKEAAQLMRSGSLALITFTEKPSRNVNPHTNRPYIDRYYDHAGSLDMNGAGGEGIERVDSRAQPGRKTDPGDAWRMCLNKGGELAVLTLPMMPSEQRDFETQKRIATAWARFFYFTPVPTPPPPTFGDVAAGFTPNEPSALSEQHGAYYEPTDEPPPHSDDDIPF